MSANYSSRTAGAKPAQLFSDVIFWKNHLQAVGVLIFGVMVIMALWTYTLPDMKGMEGEGKNISYLSYLIYGLMLWGLMQSFWLFAKYEVEKEFCRQVEDRAISKLRQLKGGNLIMKIDELPDVLPKNDNTMMSRLFDHVITEAKGRKFESSLITMQPYKDESFGKLLEINNIQRIALLSGILGTFIGLIIAFRRLDLETLEIEPISNALQFSFGTSIAGLETAILLGAFILLLRNKQEQLFQLMEKSTDTLLSLGRQALNKDYIIAEFDQLRNAIVQLSDTVESQNEEVRNQTSEILTGIVRLGQAREEFNGFLNNLTSQEQNFLQEVKDIYDYLSPEVISSELKKHLAQSVDEMSSTLQSNLEETLQRYKELHTYITQMSENLSNIEKNFDKQLTHSTAVVTKSREEIYRLLEENSQSQSIFIDQISKAQLSEQIKESILKAGEDITTKYRTDLQKMMPHVQRLEKAIEKYNTIAQKEIAQRTPPKIILQMLNLSAMFIVSIYRSIIDGVKYIFKRKEK